MCLDQISLITHQRLKALGEPEMMFEHKNLEFIIKLKNTSKINCKKYLDISWQILETLCIELIITELNTTCSG